MWQLAPQESAACLGTFGKTCLLLAFPSLLSPPPTAPHFSHLLAVLVSFPSFAFGNAWLRRLCNKYYNNSVCARFYNALCLRKGFSVRRVSVLFIYSPTGQVFHCLCTCTNRKQVTYFCMQTAVKWLTVGKIVRVNTKFNGPVDSVGKIHWKFLTILLICHCARTNYSMAGFTVRYMCLNQNTFVRFFALLSLWKPYLDAVQ